MYTGSDLDGNQSPPTRYGFSRDYGSFPLRPDPNQPYFGPGYKLDFPETAGNCAACHAPAAAVNDAYGVDPITVTEVGAEGVACDFCHKIWDVKVGAGGLPAANMPGVLSFEFRRPPEGDQFFAGPFDDVGSVPPTDHWEEWRSICHLKKQLAMWPYLTVDTYVPLQEQSQFCAPCHFGAFWDTQIYNSFGEWLESPYSDPDSGKTCQDCHMPPLDATHFTLPEAGGLERDPSKIFSHRMPGASDETLLQNAVTMTAGAYREDDKITVEVEITNDQTGHHAPTDSPLRQLILLVTVTDSEGNPLSQVDGPTVPDWGGIGDPQAGYYAQMPGTAYAKILMELWTEVTPTGAYWNPTRVLSDNRIPAMGSDTTAYVFETSEVSKTSEVYVVVKLIFRRAFIELMDQKGWDVPDIVMESQSIQLP